jgi:glutamate-1-semialdehyde 2,1-aminomutase
MITGARWALGGAQQFFGVTPDLATFGKAFANGYPLGVRRRPGGPDAARLADQRHVRRRADRPRRLQRGARRVRAEPPILRMWDVGQRLMDGVNGVCARLRLPARMVGYPVHPVMDWSADLEHIGMEYAYPADKDVVVALFQQELAQAGVLAHPSGWNPSAAHDSVALERTLLGITEALTVVAAALASNDPTFLRASC